jgi:hypothetical protein
VTVLGAASVALLAAAMAARRARPVAWALALLGAEYAAWLSLDGGPVDTRSPLYAAGLLLVAELAYDGLERGLVRAPLDLVARRGAVLVSLVVASIALGALVLAVSAIPLGQSVVLTAVGVAAAAVALALVSRLAGTRE